MEHEVHLIFFSSSFGYYSTHFTVNSPRTSIAIFLGILLRIRGTPGTLRDSHGISSTNYFESYIRSSSGNSYTIFSGKTILLRVAPGYLLEVLSGIAAHFKRHEWWLQRGALEVLCSIKPNCVRNGKNCSEISNSNN